MIGLLFIFGCFLALCCMASYRVGKRDGVYLQTRKARRLADFMETKRQAEIFQLKRERDFIRKRLKEMISIQIHPARGEQRRYPEIANVLIEMDLGTFRYIGDEFKEVVWWETVRQLVEEMKCFGEKHGRIV